jgi:chromate transporter
VNWSNASILLIGHLIVLSLVSFGGIPAALPDLRDFVVGQGWMSPQDFANCFAVVQAIPGPNMILLTGFIGWQVGGITLAIAGALATFVPSCALAFVVFRSWDRFREQRWQAIAHRGLVPVTIGLIMASGVVMARTGEAGWAGLAVAALAAVLNLSRRLNPLWIIAGAAVLGACGVV